MKKRIVLAMTVAALIAAGCNRPPADDDSKNDMKLSGSVTADGSSTVFPISQAVAEEFNNEAPDVKISVGTSGTGGGFKKFCAGETDISDASRPIKKAKPETPEIEEEEACTQNGVEYLELQVAVDGLSILVNPGNTFAQCLTIPELKKVWEPGSQVKNWNQIRPGFPNRALTLYGPGTDSGTFDYFTAEVVGTEKSSRSDYVASEDDNALVQGIAGDENALGYFGYAYYEENKDKLKTVGVDAGSGCVLPSKETINTGKYKPLSRPLYIYVARKSLARKEVVAFVDFYLDSVSDLVPDVGYIALPPATLEAEAAKWQAFKA